MKPLIDIQHYDLNLIIKVSGTLDVYTIADYEPLFKQLRLEGIAAVTLDLQELISLDTAAALFLHNLMQRLQKLDITYTLVSDDPIAKETLTLVAQKSSIDHKQHNQKTKTLFYTIGQKSHYYYEGFFAFFGFLGKLFSFFLYQIKLLRTLRYKEIIFEINESAIKALGIIILTNFLVGLVVAYQSAYQLKIYGANIFIVDMLGLSILRELAPMITAIVIAGRSGSSYTAQIGAMKITQEIDAMKTMGFDPFAFLVLPRIIALSVTMPLLIFVADLSGVFGGMIVANLDLGITTELFLDRFNEVIAAKHFLVGVSKGPFFAFLIATIAIYRGLQVKDDTQSIGFNTTKSVVESIFAVIVCDAVFSIAFTNLGI